VAEGWISYTLQRECKGLFGSLQPELREFGFKERFGEQRAGNGGMASGLFFWRSPVGEGAEGRG
jgi:hypothetical protein